LFRERSVIQNSPFLHVILSRVAAKNIGFSGEILTKGKILRSLRSFRITSGLWRSNTKKLVTVYIDEDGYYLFKYKHKGKSNTYTVKLPG